MRAEWQLLLAACRVALRNGDASGRREGLAPLAGDVADWDLVVAIAAQHGILPLAYRPLAAAPEVPAAVRDALRSHADQNAVRAISLTRQLIEIIATLEANGVAAIPLKGPMLSYVAYGDLARRQCGDLDVVIHRRDIDRARRVLSDAGFDPATPLRPGPEAALIGADYHIPFTNPAADVALELHWALVRSGLAGLRDEEWPWHHARRVALLGRQLHALSAEATLVYLCVHGCKHQWQKVCWVCDLAALVYAEPSLDWKAAHALAARVGASRMLALGLQLAAELMGAVAPLRDPSDHAPVIDRLAGDVHDSLFGDDADLSTAAALAFQCRVRSRVSDRVAYCAMLLASPQPADVRAAALPMRARALYYLLRPARLLAKYSRRALPRVGRDA